MLETVLGIFGSGGFGSILGLVGGLLNRKLDLQAKKIELEDHNAQRNHELLLRDKDLEYSKTEYANKLQVATVEAEGVVEQAGYQAMKESYKFAAPTPSDGIIDKFSKTVRPLLTLLFFTLSCLIFWQLQQKINLLEVASWREFVDLYRMVIEWILFQSGVCIGWWFAMRPGKTPSFSRKG